MTCGSSLVDDEAASRLGLATGLEVEAEPVQVQGGGEAAEGGGWEGQTDEAYVLTTLFRTMRDLESSSKGLRSVSTSPLSSSWLTQSSRS